MSTYSNDGYFFRHKSLSKVLLVERWSPYTNPRHADWGPHRSALRWGKGGAPQHSRRRPGSYETGTPEPCGVGGPIEACFDGEKEEGACGYGAFAALTETAEAEWSRLLPTWWS